MKTLIKIIMVILLIIFLGCGDSGPIDREYSITIPEVTVHVVPDYSHFPEGFQRKTVSGCATYGNEIWIVGREIDGKVHTDWKVLGHEIHHLLSHYNAEIGNPDDLM